MNNITSLLARAFFMSTPLILGALGEVIAERTGMMVTAVEGIFLIGAWGGFIGAYISGNIYLGFLLAMVCGLMVALLYALTTVYMNQHQIVMGTAISFFLSSYFWYSDYTFKGRGTFHDTDPGVKSNPIYRENFIFTKYYYLSCVSIDSNYFICDESYGIGTYP